jgi:hypothetical protein
MKRLVLFIEGDGDILAVPALANRLLIEMPLEIQTGVFIDPNVFQTGGLSRLTGRLAGNWTRWLQVACSARIAAAFSLS